MFMPLPKSQNIMSLCFPLLNFSFCILIQIEFNYFRFHIYWVSHRVLYCSLEVAEVVEKSYLFRYPRYGSDNYELGGRGPHWLVMSEPWVQSLLPKQTLVSNRVQFIISMLRTLLNLLNSPKVCILPLLLYSLAFYFYIVDLSELTFF